MDQDQSRGQSPKGLLIAALVLLALLVAMSRCNLLFCMPAIGPL